MTQSRAVADRQARRRRSARRDLHDSRREGRRAQSHELERARPSAIRRGRPTASSSRTSATSRASTSSYIEPQDGITPPREIALAEPSHYYTPAWSPDGKQIVFTRHEPAALGASTSRRGQAKVVGNDPWMVPDAHAESGVEPRLASGSRTRSDLNVAVPRDLRRTTSRPGETKQVTDGLADAMWPAWDASGKYLWFLASTDFGAELAVARHDVVRSHRDVRRCISRCCGRAIRAVAAGERRRRGVAGARGARCAAAARGAPAARRQRDARRRGATGAPRAPRRTVHDRLRRTAAAHHRRPRRRGAPLHAAQRRRRRHRLLPRADAATARRRPTAAPAAAATLHRYRLTRPARRAVRAGRRATTTSAPTATSCSIARPAAADAAVAVAPAAPTRPALFLVDADRTPPPAGQGRLNVDAAHVRRSEGRSSSRSSTKAWRNQRDYLYVPNMHGTDWPKDEGDVRRSCCRT